MFKNPIICLVIFILGFITAKLIKPSESGAFAENDPAVKTIPSLEVVYPEIVMHINIERQQQNIPVLNTDNRLTCASQRHVDAMDTFNKCSHLVDTAEPNLFTRVRRCGYENTTVLEVIACNTITSDEAAELWLSDSLTRSKLLDPGYVSIGCDRKKEYWTCVLAKNLIDKSEELQ